MPDINLFKCFGCLKQVKSPINSPRRKSQHEPPAPPNSPRITIDIQNIQPDQVIILIRQPDKPQS